MYFKACPGGGVDKTDDCPGVILHIVPGVYVRVFCIIIIGVCYVLRDSHNDAMTSTKERNLNHAHAHTSISIHTHLVRYYRVCLNIDSPILSMV